MHPLLILSCHVVPDLWLLQGGTVGGGSIKWFKEQFGFYEVEYSKLKGLSPYEIMDLEVKKIPPGSEGLIFLPYMAGERSPIWDENAKGVFFGLDYGKTRAHLIRAIFEGCAYALLHNLKTAEEVGIKINTLNSIGGAANSEIWTQIKSDITGKTICVPFSDTATTLGAAILAGVGIGMYNSFSEAIKKTVSIKNIYLPDKKRNEYYNKYYEIYLELYSKLKDTMYRTNNMLN